jgi:hypothetical protein
VTSPLASYSLMPEIPSGVPINPASGHTQRSRPSPWSSLSFGAIILHCMVLCRRAFGTQTARGKSATFSFRQAVADRGRLR